MSEPLRLANSLLARAKDLQVALSWDSATQEATEYINLILGNNPGKARNVVLARKDIQDMLKDVYGTAAAELIAEATKAWEAASPDTDIPTTDLDLVRRRARKMAREAAERTKHAFLADETDKVLLNLKNDLNARAAKAHEYAAKVAAQLKTVADAPPGSKKRWKSHDWPGRCKTCQLLDGQTVGLKEEFKSPTGPAIFGKLLTPPRHPGCECYIEILPG